MDTLRILDSHEVAYLDLTGSGIETVAHLRENGRILLMFRALSDPPKIVRFHGKGCIGEPGSALWQGCTASSPAMPARALIHVKVTRVSDSCGYAVPNCRFTGEPRGARSPDRDKRVHRSDLILPREEHAQHRRASRVASRMTSDKSLKQVRPIPRFGGHAGPACQGAVATR